MENMLTRKEWCKRVQGKTLLQMLESKQSFEIELLSLQQQLFELKLSRRGPNNQVNLEYIKNKNKMRKAIARLKMILGDLRFVPMIFGSYAKAIKFIKDSKEEDKHVGDAEHKV